MPTLIEALDEHLTDGQAVLSRNADHWAHGLDAGALEPLESGLDAARDASLALHAALGEGLEIDAKLILKIEALIQATAQTFPALVEAEAEVLERLADPIAAGRPELQKSQRISRLRAQSAITLSDLSRNVARAYEAHFESHPV